MTHQPEDEEREERIHMEIIVDAYDSEEQAMGWYWFGSQILSTPPPPEEVVAKINQLLKEVSENLKLHPS